MAALFQGALAQDPILGPNHNVYLRRLRLSRAMETQNKADNKQRAAPIGPSKADLQNRN